MIPVPAGESVLLLLGAQMQQPSCKTAVEEKRLPLSPTLNFAIMFSVCAGTLKYFQTSLSNSTIA